MSPGAPPAWRWQIHEALASTQDAAIASAQANDPGRLAIRADIQTAGRGRGGRVWVAPQGNLNLSLLLRTPPSAPDPGRWALTAALSLHEALAPYAPGLMLKWPNDLLLDGAKLAGILIDSVAGQAGAPGWVVIGYGANLAHAPHIPGRRLACLPGQAPAPQAVAERVAEALDGLAGQATPRLVASWLARAHPVGTQLDVLTPQRRLQGSFAGLTPSGALLLDGHPQPIASAEVFLHP